MWLDFQGMVPGLLRHATWLDFHVWCLLSRGMLCGWIPKHDAWPLEPCYVAGFPGYVLGFRCKVWCLLSRAMLFDWIPKHDVCSLEPCYVVGIPWYGAWSLRACYVARFSRYGALSLEACYVAGFSGMVAGF